MTRAGAALERSWARPEGSASTPAMTVPIDRTTVAMPPVYPAPGPGFLRLPDTRVMPVAPPPAPLPANGLAGSQTQGSLQPGQWPGVRLTQNRPVWTPGRLEPVVGLDVTGRVTSILEYTPGRFEH